MDSEKDINSNYESTKVYDSVSSSSSSSEQISSTEFLSRRDTISMSCEDSIAGEGSSAEKEKQIPEFSSDIGHYINEPNIDDHTKTMLLERPWKPPQNYVFPHCIVKKKGKQTRKYAQRSHLEKFHWLVLSHKDQGLYCKYCVLFSVGLGGGIQTSTPLKRLVKEPLKQFDDLLGEKGALLTHQRNKYHQRAIEAGENFLLTYHQPSLEVANKICLQREKQAKENRERLRPIISSIILLGRQNISLRGHRDDGDIFSVVKGENINDDDDVVTNDGNLRAILRFLIEAGDKKLQQYLENAPANATYLSKTTQNEIIDICKEYIQEKILSRVQKANYFSIIFDETTDISSKTQLSLSFRYFLDGIIKEDFITFCNAYEAIRPDDINGGENRLSGIAVAHIVEDLCKKFNTDLTKCVGIGTDSCSVMASDTKGAVQELSKTAIFSKRCPCSNHILNNSLARSSKVTICRNTTATMKKVVSFANASAKRHRVFEVELGGSAIQGLCETRWVERHDGHLQFQGSTLPKICNALEIIATWEDSKTACEAQCLRQALRSPEFIISSICLCDVLGTTMPLSRFLQKSSIDYKRANDAIKDTLSLLEEKREKVEYVFTQLFQEGQELAEELDVELKAPRIVSRQCHRDNHKPTESAEDYFRRAIYIPLLDNIIFDLKDRFSPEAMNLFNLNIFLPRLSYTDEDIETVRKTADAYSALINVPVTSILVEFKLWVSKWKRTTEENGKIPESLPQIIESCNKDLYPGINSLLRILATLPISVASAERSFSTLRRLKTWLRANMGQERLTGLALMNIHRSIDLDNDEILTRFAKKAKRRVNFVL